jgi:hypothetical protein
VSVTAATPGLYINTIGAGALSTNLGSNAAGASAQLRVEAPPDLIFASGFEED